MASRAFLYKDQCEKKIYSTTYKGAVRYIQSISAETFYSTIVIFNESDKAINEEFIFDKLENFNVIGQSTPKHFTATCGNGKAKTILLHRINVGKASFHFKSREVKQGGGGNILNIPGGGGADRSRSNSASSNRSGGSALSSARSNRSTNSSRP